MSQTGDTWKGPRFYIKECRNEISFSAESVTVACCLYEMWVLQLLCLVALTRATSLPVEMIVDVSRGVMHRYHTTCFYILYPSQQQGGYYDGCHMYHFYWQTNLLMKSAFGSGTVISRKVAGLIPNDAIGSNPSSRVMSLGLTQPLKEMSIRNIPGG
jgi:hypothetical protein